MKDSTRVLCVMLCIVIYYLYRVGAFMHPDGVILFTTANGVYSYSFDDGGSRKLIFSSPDYQEFDYAFSKDDVIYCVGTPRQSQGVEERSQLLAMKRNASGDHTAEVVAETKGIIHSPAFTTDLQAVFYLKKGALFKYEIAAKRETRINQENYIPNAHLLIAQDGTILCTIYDKSDQYLYHIAKIATDTGEKEILIKGGHILTWLEEGQIFLYTSAYGVLHSYDLQKKKSTKLGDVDLAIAPIVNPDQGYLLAWGPQGLEIDLKSSSFIRFPTHGMTTCYVTSFDGKQAKNLHVFVAQDGCISQMYWVPKAKH